MRVAVLGGGGAMGGLFGGWLADAGHDVALVDVAQPAVDAINAGGLVIEAKDGTRRTVRVAATTDPALVGPVDLIATFVKCYHTEAAISAAGPMIGAQTVVLTLQNGWGNAPRIAAIVGPERVVAGLTYHSGVLTAPGHVRHPGAGLTHLGELSGAPTPRLARIAHAFAEAGIETLVSDRILDEVWKKLALNVCSLPTAALLRLTADRLMQHAGTVALMRVLLQEAVAVARAQEIALNFDERWDFISGLLTRAVGGRPSMLQDVEAQRRTEIDVINGAIVDAGGRAGIGVPYNQAMVWAVQALEESYTV